jgi:adenylate kinase
MLHAAMFPLYFVGGAFGVGKSTLCQTLSQLLSGEHLTASDLIRYAPNPSEATGKATEEVLSNQDRLIAALAIRRSATDIVLLDGHFCLLDNTHAVVRLPVEIFERIQPSAIVLVEAKVGEITDRIKQRDGREIHPSLIHELMQAEREHSHAISEALGVPIMTVNSTTAAEDIVAFLRASSDGN